jgi:hypothetical protein
MATRDELIVALAKRYRRSRRREKTRIVDEFVALTEFHRKHAVRLLRSGSPHQRSGPRLAGGCTVRRSVRSYLST